MDSPNRRLTPEGWVETAFRNEVRDILDLDLFVRDEQIFEKLQRWKRLINRTATLDDVRANIREEREKV